MFISQFLFEQYDFPLICMQHLISVGFLFLSPVAVVLLIYGSNSSGDFYCQDFLLSLAVDTY